MTWTADQRQGRVPEIPWEPIVSTTLAMGRLDGTPIVEIRRDFTNLKPFVSFRSLEPFARRVAAGGIVFGYFDGTGSVVEWVGATSGQGETILESDRPIHNAVLSSDRRTLYAVLLDAKDHTEDGVWSFDLTKAKPAAQMLAQASGFDPASEGLIEELFLTPDETRLIVRDCFRECRVRIIDLATGSVRTVARSLPTNTSVRGWTNDEIVYDANCELPCPLAALNLETGQQTPLSRECSAAVLVDSPAGHLLVGDGQLESCREGLRIVASRMDQGTNVVDVFQTDDDVALVTLGDHFDAFLPQGSVLLASGGTPVGEQPPGYPLLVDAITKQTEPVPALRSR